MVNKKNILLILRISVSLGLILALSWLMRNDIGKILHTLKNANMFYLAMSLCISIPLSVALSIRLKILMEAQGIKLPLKDYIYLTFIGYFFNNFFPTSIGGDIAKAYYAYKKSNNKAGSYAAIVVDRIAGFLGVFSLAGIGLIFMGKGIQNDKVLLTGTLGMLGIVIALMYFLFRKKAPFQVNNKTTASPIRKIKEKILKLYDAINSYRDKKKILFISYALTTIMQVFTVISIYFFILCVGGNISILKLFLVIPLIWTVSMLPSINGLGVREGAFIYFLKPDIGADLAFSVSLLWLGLIILFSFVGGVLHLLYPIKTKKDMEENYDR
ncbi:MAG: lysylphosphatidylglycerol synthase transmembrane domain-containing protein [Candidatus Omnitrophota bacterium]